MTILTVSNLSMDFGGISTDTTSLEERDPAYSPTGITMLTGNATSFGWGVEPTGDDLWLHFRVHTDSVLNANADGYWMTFQNSSGQDVARVDMLNQNIFAVVYGDSTISGAQVLLGANVTTTFDMKVSTAGGNLTFEIYTGGGPVPISTATATNTAAKAGPDRVIFDNNDISNSNGSTWYFSEFIVTDSEDTRGWRLATLEPNTNGNYNDWNGDVNELGDTDSATTVQSDAGGERQSWNPTAYGGPASPSSIRAVIAKTQAARGVSGSPSQITQSLRIAATDYDGAAQVLATGEQKALLEVWDNNPNTTNPWNTADLASLEVGLLSST